MKNAQLYPKILYIKIIKNKDTGNEMSLSDVNKVLCWFWLYMAKLN